MRKQITTQPLNKNLKEWYNLKSLKGEIKLKKKIFLTLFISLILGLASTQVQAMTIVLDPGHGGTDNGASGYNGVIEKNVNLKIGLYLRDYLNQYKDVNVIMTRDNDRYLTVFDRGIIARNNKADLFVSLHNNDAATENRGVEVFVTSNTCLDKYQKQTYELASKIVNNITSLGIANRGVKISPQIKEENGDYYYEGASADWYGIIRYAMRGCKMDYGEVVEGTYNDIRDGSGIPTVLVEHAFVKWDSEFLDSDEDLKKLAQADGKAIVDYYGLQLKGQEPTPEPEDVTTTPIGIYEEKFSNILDTPAILFMLENENDKITGKDLTTAYTNSTIKLNGNIIEEDNQLKNGSIIEKDGKNYTVIIYGDTNCDGKINIMDAVTTLNHVKDKTKLTGASYIAAQTRNNNELNIMDAVNVLNVVKGKTEYKKIAQIPTQE